MAIGLAIGFEVAGPPGFADDLARVANTRGANFELDQIPMIGADGVTRVGPCLSVVSDLSAIAGVRQIEERGGINRSTVEAIRALPKLLTAARALTAVLGRHDAAYPFRPFVIGEHTSHDTNEVMAEITNAKGGGVAAFDALFRDGATVVRNHLGMGQDRRNPNRRVLLGHVAGDSLSRAKAVERIDNAFMVHNTIRPTPRLVFEAGVVAVKRRGRSRQ